MHDEVLVVGGGPAGAVVATLLASWGHRVRLVTRVPDTGRSLANSLPPSTRKLLTQVGILDLVEQVGYPTTGNTVWWGDREGQVEPFAADGSAIGFQVPRAALDPLLVARAAAAGAVVERDARVRRVTFDDDGARVSCAVGGRVSDYRTGLVVDASGRSGVIALSHRLRRHTPGGRMQALIGEWEQPGGWRIDHPSHTYIETCDTGWAWSIPISATARHLGAMVDGATSALDRGRDITATYRAQIARTPRLETQVRGARLVHAFACDASVYDAVAYGGPRFLLVGDAGSTLNPLSSFGVKKALASAWLAAVVAHTRLREPSLGDVALDFYNQWEAQVWHVNLRTTRDFAREALTRHATPFWRAQAEAPVDEARIAPGDHERLAAPAVRQAFDRLRASTRIRFTPVPDAITTSPIVRGHALVVEEAVRLGDGPHDRVRYVRGVDLAGLARLSATAADVPGLFERYNAVHAAVGLADFLGALSLLVARGVVVMDGA